MQKDLKSDCELGYRLQHKIYLNTSFHVRWIPLNPRGGGGGIGCYISLSITFLADFSFISGWTLTKVFLVSIPHNTTAVVKARIKDRAKILMRGKVKNYGKINFNG